MLKRLFFSLMLLMFIGPSLTSAQQFIPPTPTPMPDSTLATVLTRGQLICGVNQEIFGFGFLNPNTGSISGIYVDFCRALATAIFRDAGAIDLRLQTVDTPPNALLSGQLDVLFVQNTIENLTQDAQGGLDFGPPVFYDGLSIMVRIDSRIETWEDLDEQTICTLAGSDDEANLAAAMSQRGLSYDLQSLDTPAEMQEAFLAGRCNAQTLARSLLEIRRQSTDDPSAYTVWSQPFTRAAIAPVYRYGDQQWSSIVDWTVWGLIYAEELGIGSENIDEFLRLENETDENYTNRVGLPVARLLDPFLGLGGTLGLTSDFMTEVIRQVGNYGEIYSRSLGSESALLIERSLNALWSDGGLIFSPLWR
jgi:general L-amino acid transport system substrate-binding protein